MASAENLLSTRARALAAKRLRRPESLASFSIAPAKGRSVVNRHGESGHPFDGDLAAARSVGGDHRTPASCRLEQALRQPLAPRGEHGKIRPLPDRPDVGNVAEPLDAVETRELAKLLGRERTRILLVAVAGQQELERDASLAERREGLDQRQHALVGEHAADIGRGHGRRWLGQAASAGACRRPIPRSARWHPQARRDR